MAKFAVMVRTQEVEDELFDSDMKSIENLIDSVLGEDLMLNGKYLENKLKCFDIYKADSACFADYLKKISVQGGKNED